MSSFWGIYYKLQTFLYLTANGIVQGMRPLIGYNYGAGEHAPGDGASYARSPCCMSIVIMAAGHGASACWPSRAGCMGLFTANPDTVGRRVPGPCASSRMGFLVSGGVRHLLRRPGGAGQGHCRPWSSPCAGTWCSSCRMACSCCAGRLGPDGVWHAFWITEVLSALVAYPVYHRAAARH